MSLLLWVFGCGPGVVHGSGAEAGMIWVPGAEVTGGIPSTPLIHPPISHYDLRPDVLCKATEIAADHCPGIAFDPLPARKVRVRGFWLDTLEVSNADYSRFVVATGYRPPHVEEPWAEQDWNWNGVTPRPGTEDHPVVLTSWYDAREYCAWAHKRLPTEAEWQLAAHGPAGEETSYPWGDTYVAGRMNRGKATPPNFDDTEDGFLTTSPVGHFPDGASRDGALDLFGNAWEWVADVRMRTWSEVRFEDPQTSLSPHTTTLGLYAGARGFSYFADPRANLAIDYNAFPVELRRKTSGFRCARDGAAAGS